MYSAAYYQKMPWLAVPIQNVQKCLEAVADKFRVKGIPHLVILDGYDATVYTLDGRGAVAKDPYGLEFPWEPKTLMSVLPRPVRNMIKAQIDTFKSSIRKALSGILQSIMPPSVLKSLGMTA